MSKSIASLALAAVTALSVLGTASSVAAPRAADSPPATMTYDFKSGVKTTTFEDGSIIEEAFDVQKARRFVSRKDSQDVTGSVD